MIRGARVLWSGAVVLAVLGVGCSPKVKTDLRYEGDTLPRPDLILVHDFGYPPGPDGTPRSGDEIQLGSEVANVVAAQLVEEILDMGLAVRRASAEPPPSGQTYAVKGRFLSVEAGSLGRSHARSLVQLFRGSDDGPMLVEEFEVEADASGTAKSAAKKLKVLFAAEGWVSK